MGTLSSVDAEVVAPPTAHRSTKLQWMPTVHTHKFLHACYAWHSTAARSSHGASKCTLRGRTRAQAQYTLHARAEHAAVASILDGGSASLQWARTHTSRHKYNYVQAAYTSTQARYVGLPATLSIAYVKVPHRAPAAVCTVGLIGHVSIFAYTPRWQVPLRSVRLGKPATDGQAQHSPGHRSPA